MKTDDPHKLANIERLVTILVSAFFGVVGVLGFLSTGDLVPLLLFLAAAIAVKFLVAWLFRLVERILDSMG